MRPWLFAVAFTLMPAVGHAQSQVPSIRDVVELTRSGLGDAVILALIEVNGPVYPTDPETLKVLKAAGVSPAVIVAMVKSGRQAPVAAPIPVAAEPVASTAEPQVIVLERHTPDPEPRVREVYVPVPVYVAVPIRRGHDVRSPRPEKRAEPVYWGFGGKLRPDAWKPTTAADVQKDAKVPLEPQRK
jgi:hypothetical protein